MSEPRIFGPSGLTGRYYYSSDYKDLGGGRVETRTKVDVTADVEAIMTEHEKDLRSGVEVLLVAIQMVIDAWDHGDLAEAVNDARLTADAVRKSLGSS